MNRKHIDAFIPAAIEIWHLKGETAKRFAEIEKKVNLFSSLRGINRFPGLLKVFEQLNQEDVGLQDALPSLEPLQAYIQETNKYSPATLQAWLQCHPSSGLESVMAWSKRADELFAKACDGLPPFPGVKDTLTKMNQCACVAVVSSAAKHGLEHDWTAGGLMSSVDFLMSPEDGNKTEQLKMAQAKLESPVKALMVGDTDADRISAHEADALFYPIIPGKEEQSWQMLREIVFPDFMNGRYAKIQEAAYCEQLYAALGM